MVVLTGRGKYYTSGQQLEMPDFSDPELPEKTKQRRLTTKYLNHTTRQREREITVDHVFLLRNVVLEMIRFPKLLIGAVNGPAIGFGVTTLALCDVVYAVPEATFSTPFMKLGFVSLACFCPDVTEIKT